MWKNRTNQGRVVYERKKHQFTVSDLKRISGKVLEEAEKAPASETADVFYLLAKLVDEFSEVLLEKILALWGFQGYGDEALEVMKSVVYNLTKALVDADIKIEFPKEHVGDIPGVRF